MAAGDSTQEADTGNGSNGETDTGDEPDGERS